MVEPLAAGERIMVFKEKWLLRILLKEKTLEIRGARYTGKTYLLGCRNKIFARASFGDAIRIETLDHWQELRPLHRVSSDKVPYKKTWGLPIQKLTAFPEPYSYTARK